MSDAIVDVSPGVEAGRERHWITFARGSRTSRPPASRTSDRNRGIDALRGMSILFVVFNHIGIRIPLAKTALATWLPAWLLRGLNWNGYESVFLFFVISGFLITRRSLERWCELPRTSLRQFYLFRVSRILPTLVLVVALFSAFHLAGVPNFVIDKPGQSLAGAIASVFGLYLNVYEARYNYLAGGWDVLWSLSIEEVFYLAFPLLCVTLGRVRWAFVAALAALVLSLPYTHAVLRAEYLQSHSELAEIWLEKAYLPGMAAIAMGVLAALLAQRIASPPKKIPMACCLIGLTGIGAVFFAGQFVFAWLHDSYMLLLTGSAASLVLGLHWQAASGTPWRLRALGWLCSCGKLSYEIYLFHMFCVFGVVGLARACGLDKEWGWLWYVPTIALSWLLGLAVSRGFSQPVERWLRQRFADIGTKPDMQTTAD
jgi:peptidoglycan/LPS O-acetylase OafA/YrhL